MSRPRTRKSGDGVHLSNMVRVTQDSLPTYAARGHGCNEELAMTE